MSGYHIQKIRKNESKKETLLLYPSYIYNTTKNDNMTRLFDQVSLTHDSNIKKNIKNKKYYTSPRRKQYKSSISSKKQRDRRAKMEK